MTIESARNLAKILSQKPQGEPGTRTNPLKAEGTINEIATRVMDGTWTTLDLEALADYALQSQPSSLAGTFEEAWRKRFPHAEVKPASVDDFAKGIAREFWNAALKSKQSQPVIQPLVSVHESLPEMTDDSLTYLVYKTGYADKSNNGWDIYTAQGQAAWYGHIRHGKREPMGFGILYWKKLDTVPEQIRKAQQERMR